MSCYKPILLTLLGFFAASSGQRDVTRLPVTPGENNCQVVEAVVKEIEEATVAGGNSKIFGTTKGFLRLIAYVETRDGKNLQGRNQGGLWKVDQNQFATVRLSKPLRDQYQRQIFQKFDFDYARKDLKYSDLDTPLSSALFALLYILLRLGQNNQVLANIPSDSSNQGTFFATYYRQTTGAKQRFDTSYREFERYSCMEVMTSRSDCKLDIMDGWIW
jgi:hypothetical protein